MVNKSKYYLYLFVSLNILLYFVNVATWIIIPESLTLNIALSIFNTCFTCLICYFNQKKLEKYIRSSLFKKFSDVFISSILIFLIIGLVNYLFFKHPVQFDLTSRSKNSLTEQSKQIVQNLDQKKALKMSLLANKNQFMFLQQLIDLYRFHHANFSYEHIDIELRPDLVSKYEIKQAPSIIVEYDGKVQKVENMSELALTNAIKKLSLRSQTTIYYTSGHGELGLLDQKENGGTHLAKQLRLNDILVKDINLLTIKSLPKDLTSLVVWGPQIDFQEKEIEILRSLVESKKGIVFALNPSPNGDQIPRLRAFLKEQGLIVRNDFVIDTLSHINGSSGTVPLIQKFTSSHPLVRHYNKSLFFPLVSSIVPVKKLDLNKFLYQSILATSTYPNSWGENTISEILNSKISFDDKDSAGPMTIAASLTNKDSDFRILVFGNSTFVQNSYASFSNHFNFVMNAFAWANFEDQLISFNQASLDEKPLFINRHQIGMSFYFTILFLPCLLLIAAGLIKKRQFS